MKSLQPGEEPSARRPHGWDKLRFKIGDKAKELILTYSPDLDASIKRYLDYKQIDKFEYIISRLVDIKKFRAY